MASIRIVFVTKSDPDSGNFNTAERICRQLVAARPSWQYKIVSVTAPNEATWAQVSSDLLSAHVLLCLHFYRCAEAIARARRCAGSGALPPVIGIAGGTDLNVDSADPARRSVMREFVGGCRHVVVFSNSLKSALLEMMDGTCQHLSVSIIPQGIPFPLLQPLESGESSKSGPESCQRYFIILGRIRPVKNCLSVLEPFCRWRRDQVGDCASVRLLFVGDIEDSAYGEDFKSKIGRSPGVHLLSGVHHKQAVRLLGDSLGLINCSISEGQSNSILEAMSLGVPVIASAIAGNLDLVRHMETGFVFEDDKQLIQWMSAAASLDLDCRKLINRITKAAQAHVQDNHSIARELQSYVRLILECRSDLV